MSKVVGRLPRSVVDVVADPIHEVVQFSVSKFGVEDRLNLEFWDVVHMDGQRGGHDAATECVGHVGLQVAYVEYIMNLHGRCVAHIVRHDGPRQAMGLLSNQTDWQLTEMKA